MKTRKMASAIAASLAAMALTTAAAEANLVTNGDFSANASSYVTYPGYSPGGGASGSNPLTPTGWSIAGTPEPVVGVNGPDTGFYASNGEPFAPSSTTGVRDFAFMQDTSIYTNVSISQLISTVAGQTYTLTYAAAQRSGDSSASMQALVLDATNSNSTITTQTPSVSTSNFGDFALTFTARSTSTMIEFLNNTNNGADNTVDVSNVVLTALPQPGTIGLLGVGSLALLGGWALRRRVANKL